MPKATNVPLTLKFRWNTECVMLYAKLDNTVTDLKKELAKSLNDSQILNKSFDDEDDEDNIDIPMPTQGEISDDEDKDKKGNKMDEDDKPPIEPEEVRIGLPNQKSMTSFRDISDEDSTLDALGVKEHMTLAFVIGPYEKFQVEIPTYQD